MTTTQGKFHLCDLRATHLLCTLVLTHFLQSNRYLFCTFDFCSLTDLYFLNCNWSLWRNFQNSDIVLLKADANRTQWPMAKVVGIYSDANSFVWSVKLLIGKTQNHGDEYLNVQYIELYFQRSQKFDSPPQRGCQVSRCFGTLRGASVVTDTI